MLRRGLLCVPIISAMLLVPSTPAATHPVKRMGRSESKTDPPEPLDLNDASETELKSVPGITAKTARIILDGRPYDSVADLAKAGVSKGTINRIRKNVTVTGRPNKAERPVAQGGQAGMVWVRTG